MTKFQVNHVKLSKVNERRAKRFAKILFRCLRMLSDVMRTFLISRGLMNRRTIRVQDSQGFLYAIKKRLNFPNFLNNSGKTKTQIQRIFLNAIKGRNATCHNNLPEVLTYWKLFLESWVQVCFLIGSNQTAGRIKRVVCSLKKNTRKIPVELISNATAYSVFRKLEMDTRLTTQWTPIKEEAYAFLGNKFYDLLMDEYSPALTHFATTRRHQCRTSVIDCYAMTELIKTKCSANDFKTPHGGTSFDLAHVENAADGRHAAIHEKKSDLLSNWPNFLASMIYVCKGMRSKGAARTIARLRSQLLGAQNWAIRSVNSGQQLRSRPSPIQAILKTNRPTKIGRQLKRLVKNPGRNKAPLREMRSRRRRTGPAST